MTPKKSEKPETRPEGENEGQPAPEPEHADAPEPEHHEPPKPETRAEEEGLEIVVTDPDGMAGPGGRFLRRGDRATFHHNVALAHIRAGKATTPAEWAADHPTEGP